MSTRTFWFFASQSVIALVASIGFAAFHYDGPAAGFGCAWGALVLGYVMAGGWR